MQNLQKTIWDLLIFIYLKIYSENKVEQLKKYWFNEYKVYYKEYLRQKNEWLKEWEETYQKYHILLFLNDELMAQRKNYISQWLRSITIW